MNYYELNNDYQSPFNNFTRNFEQLITERGDPVVQQNTRLYNEIFDKIKFNLFEINLPDINSLEEQNEYSKKYNTRTLNENIVSFKKDIVGLYNKKIEFEINLDQAVTDYTVFCKNINEFLQKLTDQDTTLTNLLLTKIDSYYTQLNIKNLTDELTIINSEYIFLKKTIQQLSSIQLPSLCSICMEEQVSWFIDPCGHTLCGGCKNKCIKTINCHYCRTPKNEYKQLFLI